MPPRYTLWDAANRGHILAEGEDHPERELYEEDVDEVILQRRHAHVVMGTYEQAGERRVDVVGKTRFDRVLFVTFAPRPMDAVRPISARDATRREIRLYEEKLRQRRRP